MRILLRATELKMSPKLAHTPKAHVDMIRIFERPNRLSREQFMINFVSNSPNSTQSQSDSKSNCQTDRRTSKTDKLAMLTKFVVKFGSGQS